jgi:endonuclease YncB( thermonuclease family)
MGADLPVSGSSWHKVIAIACGMALEFGAWAQDSPLLVGIVTAVNDGDTIKVQLASGPVIVELANIDAPEFKQPGGPEARMALHHRIVGEEVTLDATSKDGPEQLVAVVYLGDENINGWLVKQGHAWAYRQHADEAEYCVWENAARSLKRGLWDRDEWLAPWEWRLGGKGKAIPYTNYRRETTAECIAAMK